MKRIIALVLAIVCLLGMGALASSDALITLSYLNGTIKPQLKEDVEKVASSAVSKVTEPDLSVFSRDGMLAQVANRALEKLQMKGYYMYSTNGREEIVLKKDDVLSGMTGTKFLMRDGSAVVINDTIVNITAGSESKAGSAVPQSTNFIIPKSNGAGIKITSDRATVWVDGVYRIVSLRYRAKYFECADALKTMNLFRGSNIGYELDRGATRTEALVMLLRLLGEEESALKYTGKHPFTDVPDWASKYVAYAYNKGYTNGISKTLFGSNNPTNANHYMTFLLRSLGYDDNAGDFKWDRAIDFAKSFEIITEGEYSELAKSSFMRDQMVYISYYGLFANLKDSEKTLLSKLISTGAVSKTSSDKAIAKVTKPRL